MPAEMPKSPNQPSETGLGIGTYLCGVLMGAADIVPGVSGGTVALILGVYQRLLTAISRFDSEWLALLFARRWRSLARHVDLHFLLLLVAGILSGALALAGIMDTLLHQYRAYTYAAFFGLILASGLLVGRMTSPRSAAQATVCVVLGLAAAYGALQLMRLDRIAPISGHHYTFMCGLVAICAMILPGVSGAYLLLLLGKYEEITGILKRLPRLEVSSEDLATVVVFACGCLMGLLLFSRFLRWLLRRHWSGTMSVLCGFMIGSLYRVWPFQADLSPNEPEIKRKLFQPQLPESWDRETFICLLIAVVCLVLVLAFDTYGARLGSEGRRKAQDPSAD